LNKKTSENEELQFKITKLNSQVREIHFFYLIHDIISSFFKLEETKIELEKYRDESENLQIIISDYEAGVKQLTNGTRFEKIIVLYIE
jgi:hypothetical protein